LKDVFEKTFTELGGKGLLKESFNAGETDFRSLLSKVRASKADAMYLAGYYSEIAVLMRQAKELGLKVKTFSCVGVYEPQFIDLAKSAAEGLIFSAPAYDPKSHRPATIAFVENFKKSNNNTEPGIFQAHGYDSLKVIAEAIKMANTTNTDEVRKALYSIKNFEGATGVMSIDKNGDVDKDSRILQVKNGSFVSYEGN